MNELHDWLSQQHHGLRTFQLFRQELTKLTIDDPDRAALYTLLSMLVAPYIEAFDEEPVPISVADRAFGNLLRAVAGLDFSKSADGRLIDCYAGPPGPIIRGRLSPVPRQLITRG